MNKSNLYTIILLFLLGSCGSKETPKDTTAAVDQNVVTLNDEQIQNAGISLGIPKLEWYTKTSFVFPQDNF